MEHPVFESIKKTSALEKAMIVAIIAGLCLTAFLLLNIKAGYFSSVYIYPESYQSYPEGDEISFTYGITSFERGRMSYDIEYYINNNPLDKKEIELNPGETMKERKMFTIPEIDFPAKIRLKVTTSDYIYEVHYWLEDAGKM